MPEAGSIFQVSLAISIMLSLGVFILLLAEIIPPTSLTVPLLVKYLTFTMILVTLSVVVTIVVLNINFRSPATHRMAPWVRTFFLNILPRLLCMSRPPKDDDNDDDDDGDDDEITDFENYNKTKYNCQNQDHKLQLPVNLGGRRFSNNSFNDFPPPPPLEKLRIPDMRAPHPSDSSDAGCNGHEKEFSLANFNITPDVDPFSNDGDVICSLPQGDVNGDGESKKLCPEIERAILGVRFMAQHHRNLDNYFQVFNFI